MSKNKDNKKSSTNWVRTGGNVGDNSMQDLIDFNDNGQGVDENNIKFSDHDPNKDLTLKQLKGSD